MVLQKIKKIVYSATLIAGISASSGCATLISLEDYLPPAQSKKIEHKTVDSVINHYFVPRAHKFLKDTDVHPGPALGGYVTVNFWGKLMSFITFNGAGSNVIIPKSQLRYEGVRVLNHEFTHILDYADREGIEEFVDLTKFEQAYHRFIMDPVYKIPAREVYRRKQSGSWLTDIVGIGKMSEELAWTAGYASMNPDFFPNYLKKTLTGIFRKEILFPNLPNQ